MAGDDLTHVHEVAAGLERADASARVLGARARAARSGAGPAAAFAALAATGPDGLVPPVGTGGAVAARHLEHAAVIAALAVPALSADVVDAVAVAATTARTQAGGANVLDPAGASRAVRHEVAAVRGIASHCMPRDTAWQAMRVGTFIPRAGWMTALLLACARVAADDPAAAATTWGAAALVAGVDPASPEPDDHVLMALLSDPRLPTGVRFAVEEVAAALFALSRDGAGDQAALAFARATAARLADPALADAVRDDAEATIGELLDVIGALAVACMPDGRRTRSAAA